MSLIAHRADAAVRPSSLDIQLRAVGLFLIYSLCAVGSWHPLDNYSDFWAHAAVGRWIVAHHWHAPRHALLLWSADNSWIAHSWLSEALIFMLLRHAGEDAAPAIALLLTGAFMLLGCSLLWSLCRVNSSNFGVALIVFCVTAYAASGRLLARPEIFSIFLFAVLLTVLVRRDSFPEGVTSSIVAGALIEDSTPINGMAERPAAKRPSRTKSGVAAQDSFPEGACASERSPLVEGGRNGRWETAAGRLSPFVMGVILAPMMALWTNLHGGVLVGVIALWIYAVAEVIQERGSRESRAMVGVAAVCTVATLINPYGYRYYSIYKAVTTLTFSHIVEWRPLFGYPYIDVKILCAIMGLAVVAAVMWVLTPGRRWAHIVWLGVFAAMAVAARRNMAFMDIAALAISVPYLRMLGSRPAASANATAVSPSGKKMRRGLGANAAALPPSRTPAAGNSRRAWAIAAGCVYLVLAYFSMDWLGVDGIASATSPMMASSLSAAVRKMGVHDRVFNDYDYASYLEWKLGGDPKLFIDGLNAYPDSLFADYQNILNATPRGLRMLDDEQINCVIGRGRVPTEPDLPRLYYVLAASPKWALAYYGDDGPIWVRRLPEYKAYWEGVPVYHGRLDAYDIIIYLHTSARMFGPLQ